MHPLSTDSNKILYTHYSTIQTTDRKTNEVEDYCKFSFHPRCFKELDGMLVAGGVHNSVGERGTSVLGTSSRRVGNNGADDPSNVSFLLNTDHLNVESRYGGGIAHWRGLFSFHNKHTGVTYNTRLGSYINNHVTINRKNGSSNNIYTSYACNNDMFLYQTEISNSRIELTDLFNLNFALNHAALSDDGKNLIVGGDSSDVVLLHPNQTQSFNDPVNCFSQTIKTDSDTGFYTSFDSTGIKFATCFQDGSCLIYDLRNLSKPLKKIYSTRRISSNGAFRNCQFSRGTDDLLFITEHVGRVHIIDTRDFEKHQVIMLPINHHNSSQEHPDSPPTNSSRHSGSSLMDRSRTSRNSRTSVSSSISSSSTNSSLQSPSVKNKLLFPKVLDYRDVVEYERKLFPQRYSPNHYYDDEISPVDSIPPGLDMAEADNGMIRGFSINDEVTRNSFINAHNLNNYNILLDSSLDEEVLFSEDEDDGIGNTEGNGADTNTTSDVHTRASSAISRSPNALQDNRLHGIQPTYMPVDNEYYDNQINGFAYFQDNKGSHLVVGCDRGLITWDIDSWSRRSFSSYQWK